MNKKDYVSRHLLRKQVATEIRLRRYVFYTVMLLSIVYISVGLIFGDSGYFRYKELVQKRSELEMELASIKSGNEHLSDYLDAYGKDDFYIEKHAREDFGMANSDEYVFVFEK